MQVKPITPQLKPPGTKRMKLNCDALLSKFAFRINLRRYIKAAARTGVDAVLVDTVGQCRLNLSNPR